MIERLREIEQMLAKIPTKATEDNPPLTLLHVRLIQEVPYLLGVIKEQAEEIDALLKLSNAQGEAMKATMSILKSSGEHSEDAKPLDGTVQE